MRYSANQTQDGQIRNGFDYDLQVWIRDFIVQPCGHPDSMRANGELCCNAYKYAGQDIRYIGETDADRVKRTGRA